MTYTDSAIPLHMLLILTQRRKEENESRTAKGERRKVNPEHEENLAAMWELHLCLQVRAESLVHSCDVVQYPVHDDAVCLY